MVNFAATLFVGAAIGFALGFLFFLACFWNKIR